MITRTYPRSEPCSVCGNDVLAVEAQSDGIAGGLATRTAPQVFYRHADREYAGDQVDGQCTWAQTP